MANQTKTFHVGQQDVDDTITPLPDLRLSSHITIKVLQGQDPIKVYAPTNNGGYLELAEGEDLRLDVENANRVRVSSDSGSRLCYFGY